MSDKPSIKHLFKQILMDNKPPIVPCYEPLKLNPDTPKINVCGCCDTSLNSLLKKLRYTECANTVLDVIFELSNPINFDIESIIQSDLKDFEVAAEDVKGMIDVCTHKLEDLTIGRALLNKCITHLKNKTMVEQTLWEFIVDNLKFKMNSGYDYLIMSYLSTYDITEHGSGIRCSWLIDKNMNLL